MLSARVILEAASGLLMDEQHVRWTLPELTGYLNEGVKAIILAKPSASTQSIAVPLIEGTLQHVPQTGTPTPLRILSIPRNLASVASPRIGGRAIRPTKRSLLDAQEPNWHESRYVRFRREVRQYTFDEENPLEFYTYPGNDGTGVVEAVVSVLPVAVSPTDDDSLIGSYDVPVGLQAIYQAPLTDYVCYRAQIKDDLAANTGRSAIHYQSFATAIGLKIQVERATSPNRERAQ
jgi:hypothetical protein